MRNDKAQGSVLLNIICVLALLLSIAIIIPALQKSKDSGPGYARIMCMSNMKQINLALICYKEDENSWLLKENWCDIVKPYIGSDDNRFFQCPKDKIGPCSYAMNENIPDGATELPGDLVVLFESAPGWNRIGGADDVVTNRHDEPGANIAFADGRVEFIPTSKIPTLKWTMDDPNNETEN